jgi:hypothetical protein
MVNRNSYLSLLESVNEAVVGTPKVTKVTKGGKSNTPQVTNTVSSGNASGSGMQWGDPSIGGAMNGAQLAAWLNSQSSGGPANPSVPNTPKSDSLWLSNAKTIGGARPGTTPAMTSLAPKGKVTRSMATAASMAEEWDEVDEILAEALEMFGEEDLVTILEYFEETGELPDEFIDLIASING